MKKKIFTMAGALALVAAIGVGSTLAYFTDNAEATNVVTTGHVDIELLENNEITEGLEFSKVVPGEVLKKNVDIKVNAGSRDCFIRVKAVSAWDNENIKVEIPVCVSGWDSEKNVRVTNEMTDITDLYWAENANTGWIKSDEYWYFCEKKDNSFALKAVKAEETVDFFSTVTIPSEWNNTVADETFKINLVAEAIQADNLNPDYKTTGTDLSFWGVTILPYEGTTTVVNPGTHQ